MQLLNTRSTLFSSKIAKKESFYFYLKEKELAEALSYAKFTLRPVLRRVKRLSSSTL